jgi:hypothetical protein
MEGRIAAGFCRLRDQSAACAQIMSRPKKRQGSRA